MRCAIRKLSRGRPCWEPCGSPKLDRVHELEHFHFVHSLIAAAPLAITGSSFSEHAHRHDTQCAGLAELETLLVFPSLIAHERKTPAGACRDLSVDVLCGGASQPQPPHQWVGG